MDVTRLQSRSDRASILIDDVWLTIFVGLLLLLLTTLLKTMGALAFLVLTAFLLLRQRSALWRTLPSAWPLVILPLLALGSTLWSDNASATLRASLQYAATFIFAVTVARTASPRKIVSAAYYAFLAVSLVSLLDLRGALSEHRALQGLFDSKNSMAFAASTLLLLSLGLALDRHCAALTRLLAMVSAPFAVALIVLSQSTGAYVSTAAGAAIVLLATFSSRLTPPLRLTALVLAVALTPPLLVARPILEAAWTDVAENQLHKDLSTLTGRTVLWSTADSLAREKPILGHGYSAFWVQGSLDAEGLWRRFDITNRSGFNFHNQWKELSVDLGWVGIAEFAVVLGLGLGMMGLRVFLRPNQSMNTLFALLAALALRTPVESLLFYPFSSLSVLMLVCACIGIAGPAGAVGRKRQTGGPSQKRRRLLAPPSVVGPQGAL